MFELSTLLILIVALPLASTLLTAALGPKLLRGNSHLPTVLALLVSFLCSVILLVEVRFAQDHKQASPSASTEAVARFDKVARLWTWASVPASGGRKSPESKLDSRREDSPPTDFTIDITLRADALTCLMLVMVTFISMLVAIYSIGYMHGDRGYWRFFTYISLFVFSMCMLVTVSNFLLLYVFWEAVGVCSYLLIGFWYEKNAAAAAGKKAFLVNRVGDFGFALAIFLIFITYGTLNFHDTSWGRSPDLPVQEQLRNSDRSGDLSHVAGVLGETALKNPEDFYVGGTVGLAICLLLMLGACGKSAQFPLHVWLPDAMEGPTPVSALIHAATMVTAGVYMVARCTPLFMVSKEAQLTVACIGGFTALLAALIALTQFDLKRVLAYSTISQLGYMFLAVGCGTFAGISAGMFHMLTHAFFKALLFLAAGSVMHAMGGVIDMRRFGGLRKKLWITCITFGIGGVALSGLPPLAGFWSKDAILAVVFDRSHAQADYNWVFNILFWVAVVTAGLTAFYTFRAFFLTFFGKEEIPDEAAGHAHESPPVMWVPQAILAFFAIVAGGFSLLYSPGADSFLVHTPSLSQRAGPPQHASRRSHVRRGRQHRVRRIRLGAGGLRLPRAGWDRRAPGPSGNRRPVVHSPLPMAGAVRPNSVGRLAGVAPGRSRHPQRGRQDRPGLAGEHGGMARIAGGRSRAVAAVAALLLLAAEPFRKQVLLRRNLLRPGRLAARAARLAERFGRQLAGRRSDQFPRLAAAGDWLAAAVAANGTDAVLRPGDGAGTGGDVGDGGGLGGRLDQGIRDAA